jgi:myosin-6
MTAMGLPDSEKLAIYMTVAGVLHLGNVTFEESAEDTKGGCQVSKGSIGSLKLAAQLLGCEEDQLRESLITRIMQAAGSKGSLIKYVYRHSVSSLL